MKQISDNHVPFIDYRNAHDCHLNIPNVNIALSYFYLYQSYGRSVFRPIEKVTKTAGGSRLLHRNDRMSKGQLIARMKQTYRSGREKKKPQPFE